VGKLFRIALAAVVLSVLSACGGGGGSAGSSGSTGDSGGTGTTNNGSIQLSLVDQAGTPSNLLSGSAGLLAKAVVTNSSGGSVGPGVLVTFSLDGTIAALSATSGTALTGSDGVATMGLKAATGTGAGTLTASAVVVGTTAVTKKATFSVDPPANASPKALNFVTAVPSDKSIVIKGAGGISRSEIALLTFSVVDATNTGIPNVKVNFSMLPGTDVVLGAASGLTDPSGKVTVSVNSGATVTNVVVNAVVQGTSIGAKSDTISVTTGLLANLHFGIYPDKRNIEAFNIAGIENIISVSLGDANGGVIADGTSVTFTTDGGTISGDNGTTDTARCLTKNGWCSVKWRSAAPLIAAPRVTASASNGVEILVVSTQFTANASFGRFVGLPTDVTFSAASCVDQVFDFTVVGNNDYSMPTDTALSIPLANNVTATISPPKVTANAAVVLAGTRHTLVITPKTGCVLGVGSLNLEMKAPSGQISASDRINVRYVP
jgi:hypothetical protein